MHLFLLICNILACQRDSGGPLVAYEDGNKKKPLLIGVVSWGKGCAVAKYPGVYAKVIAAREWIEEIAHV